jgi:putative Mg2+ transporter-C (MgtC) family protein
MESYAQQAAHHVDTMLTLSNSMVRLILAAILGGIIGLERELSHKPAGLRTNMFICFGSAMFTLLSAQLAGEFVGDHTRIAAQIIPGIGFIGAGSILHARGSVQGLTTAATLFVVASVGMAAGGGFYLEATFATIIILIALKALGAFEARFNLKPLFMSYEATGDTADAMITEINRVLEEHHHMMESVQIANLSDGFMVRFAVNLTHKDHRTLLEALKSQPAFRHIAFAGERE